MSRSSGERSSDIIDAVERCRAYRDHLTSTDELIDAMAYDAVLRNLAVIGEAVRTWSSTSSITSWATVPKG